MHFLVVLASFLVVLNCCGLASQVLTSVGSFSRTIGQLDECEIARESEPGSETYR